MRIASIRTNIVLLLSVCLLTSLFAVTAGCGGGGGGGGSTSNTVNGVVKDSLLGDQVAQGATVTIGGVSGKTCTVDQAEKKSPDYCAGNTGGFQLRGVPNGTRVASVTLTDGTTQSIAFAPAVGSGTTTLELFVNIGQISGRVLRSNGQPASNAFITVAATGETFETNSDGTFLATLVPKGETSIDVIEGTSSTSKTVNVNYGNNNVGDITLKDDTNPNPPGTPYTLYGTVTVAGVGTPAGTTVLLFRNDVQIESTVTDSDGRYFFYVPVGTYKVRAVRNTFEDATSNPINLTNASQPIRTNLTMSPR